MTIVSSVAAPLWLAAAMPIAFLLTWVVLKIARRHNFVDRPNERSSHRNPTAFGGGWGVVLTVLPFWAVADWLAGTAASWLVLGATALLVTISWLDDLRNVSPVPRLAVHLIAVALGLSALPDGALIFQGLLPPWLDRLAAGLAWVWFVNLYNFMDGIDGITGVETAAITLGLALVLGLAGGSGTSVVNAMTLAGAILGFLVWNWQPARIFLGDVGSVPIGYLTGWLLLTAAAQGLWAAALILPGYYLGDATLTLLRRAARGEKVWRAHREHFYQQAVRAGRSHAAVALRVLWLNLTLIVLATATLFVGPASAWTLIILACAAVALTLGRLGRPVAPSSPRGAQMS